VALGRLLDLFAHRFLCFSSTSLCFSYSYVLRQTKLASSLVNFWAHENNSAWLIDSACPVAAASNTQQCATYVSGPMDTPHNVQILSNTISSSATVCWRLPAISAWNGHLRGCAVRYQQLKPSTSSSFTVVNVTDITQRCVVIDRLRPSGHYELSVSCFNSACLGPYSDTLQFTVDDDILTTAPYNVTAEPINSTSIEVTFRPPRFTAEQRSDLFYIITARRSAAFRRQRSAMSVADRSAGTISVRGALLTDGVQVDYVTGLDKFAMYRVTVRCLTAEAAGPPSEAVTVQTLDDGNAPQMFTSVCRLSVLKVKIRFQNGRICYRIIRLF